MGRPASIILAAVLAASTVISAQAKDSSELVGRYREILGSVQPVEEDAHSLTPDQKRRLMTLTSIFENGEPKFHYDYIEYLDDGRGFTAGRVGFSTGTQDLYEVVKLYDGLKPGNPLHRYLPRLAELADISKHSQESHIVDDISGLEGFVDAWKTVGSSPEMIRAQEQVIDRMYYLPAMAMARLLGVKLPFGKAILYDTLVMHGSWIDDPDTIEWMILKTIERTGFVPLDHPDRESKWLKAFLEVRHEVLLNAHDPETRAQWRENEKRATDLMTILRKKTFDQLGPQTKFRSWYYKGKIE